MLTGDQIRQASNKAIKKFKNMSQNFLAVLKNFFEDTA
jgi:hypothetical protein